MNEWMDEILCREYLCYCAHAQSNLLCVVRHDYVVGRYADTEKLGLDKVDVVTNHHNGKVICMDERTTADNIYAIGDVVDGAPELTPVAIQAGKLLARRLFSCSEEKMVYRVSRFE